MSAVGHCADNAACESFLGILKRERVNRRQYRTRDEARADLFDYLERFHDPRMRRRVVRADADSRRGQFKRQATLRVSMLLFVLIFLFAGLGLVLVGRNFEQKARRSASWPTASGHLERCEVVELPGSGTEDASSWQLQIRYSYAVRGRRYESTQYAFGYGDGRDDKKHRLIATALRSQAKLTVHYNPSNPSEAVLSTQVQSNITTLGYFALAMALVSELIWMVD